MDFIFNILVNKNMTVLDMAKQLASAMPTLFNSLIKIGADAQSTISWIMTACVTNCGFPIALENETRIVMQAPKNIPMDNTRKIGAAASHSSPKVMLIMLEARRKTKMARLAALVPTITMVLEKYFLASLNEQRYFCEKVGKKNCPNAVMPSEIKNCATFEAT